jgi:molecular chaperone GrpE
MSAQKKKKKTEPGTTTTETLPPETPAETEEPLQVMEAPPAASATPEAPVPGEDPLKDQLLRLQADFENFRRRTQRERSELYQRANEDLIGELLSVLDHFELGFDNAAKHEANPDVVAGFRMVFDQALTTLGKFGLQPLDVVGEPFDPHQHEAVTQLPSQEYPEDTVVAQTRRGYLLSDRLLRAAQVVVSSGPGPREQDTAAVDNDTAEEDEA